MQFVVSNLSKKIFQQQVGYDRKTRKKLQFEYGAMYTQQSAV